jgi:high-affinity K+ transport system ATPase subunit B
MKTGKTPNVNHRVVKQSDNAPKTYFLKWIRPMARRKFTPEELHARLIVTIGIILAVVFAVSVSSMLYALLFITQPMAQAPNDAAFIDLVSTLCVFLTGTLSGILSANGLKSKPKPKEGETDEPTR